MISSLSLIIIAFQSFHYFQPGQSFGFNHQHNHHPIITTTSSRRSYNRSLLLYASSSIKLDLEIASICQGGSDPDRPIKVNQDAYFIHHFSTNNNDDNDDDDYNLTFLGIFDGHGKKGHVLNAFLSKRLPQLLEDKCTLLLATGAGSNLNLLSSSSSSSLDIEKVLIESFEEVDEEARLNTDVPAGRSGTTCIVCVIDTKSGVIHTANVGDSRAIIGIQKQQVDNIKNNVKAEEKEEEDEDEDEDEEEDGKWVVKALSHETTTKREEERLRIEEKEGRIDGQGNVWYGPIGIAMTRSLGNAVMRRAGVIPTPEVTCFDWNDEGISCNKPCIVLIALGTDGIFDVMSNENTIKFIDQKYQETNDLQVVMNSLADEATRKWKAGLPFDVKVDDITCVSSRFQLD